MMVRRIPARQAGCVFSLRQFGSGVMYITFYTIIVVNKGGVGSAHQFWEACRSQVQTASPSSYLHLQMQTSRQHATGKHKIDNKRRTKSFSLLLLHPHYPILLSRCTPLDLYENAVRCSKLATSQKGWLLRNPHPSISSRFSDHPLYHHLPSGAIMYLEHHLNSSPKSKPQYLLEKNE